MQRTSKRFFRTDVGRRLRCVYILLLGQKPTETRINSFIVPITDTLKTCLLIEISCHGIMYDIIIFIIQNLFIWAYYRNNLFLSLFSHVQTISRQKTFVTVCRKDDSVSAVVLLLTYLMGCGYEYLRCTIMYTRGKYLHNLIIDFFFQIWVCSFWYLLVSNILATEHETISPNVKPFFLLTKKNNTTRFIICMNATLNKRFREPIRTIPILYSWYFINFKIY